MEGGGELDRDEAMNWEALGTFDLKVIYRKMHTGFDESKDVLPERNTVIANRYLVERTIGQAAFSSALECVDLASDPEDPQSVCLKRVKNNKDCFDQSLDEIQLLQYINQSGDPEEHHILKMYDFFYYKEHLYIVSELLRRNLYEYDQYIRKTGEEPYFTLPNLKKITVQCLEALQFVHNLGIIHCDLKPENIVINSYSRVEVKLIDFGSSCFQTDEMTTYIQSRSYRAPEVVLGVPYDARIDVWSMGCVLAEMLTGYVLFQNDSVQTMLARIQGILGAFPESLLTRGKDTHKYMTEESVIYERVRVMVDPDTEPLVRYLMVYPKRSCLRKRLHLRRRESEEFVDFLAKLLMLDSEKRPTAAEALRLRWLSNDLAQEPSPRDMSRDPTPKAAHNAQRHF